MDTNHLAITRTYMIHSKNFRDKQNSWSQYGITIDMQQQ